MIDGDGGLAGSRPRWLQLADAIRADIASGLLRTGDRVPSHAQLRRQFGVSDTVVRNALLTLKETGTVYGVTGVGTFVGAAPVRARRGG